MLRFIVADTSLILVTYNREDSFKRVIQSIDPTFFDKIVIVHDGGGSVYSEKVVSVISSKFDYLPQTENIGVGRCKQLGVNHVLENSKSNNIFIIEDDVLVTDNGVWDLYINFSKRTGVWHTNWNDCQYKTVQSELDYDGLRGTIHKDCAGSFSYFNRNMFKFCEYPSDMKNSFEHISVELQLIDKDLLPPFWNFVCPKGSSNYLENIGTESTITNKPAYSENYQASFDAFKKRHGRTTSDILPTSIEDVLEKLKFLEKNYSKYKV